MGWVPVALQVVSTIMQYSGQKKAASAARDAAARQQVESNYEAQQMDQNAGQEQAASQRAALNERHRAQLLASRAAAVAGSSGGGITDPSLQDLFANIAGEGAYRAGVQLYQGEDNARRLRMGAEAKRYEGASAVAGGEQKAAAYDTMATGSLFSGAVGLAKYAIAAKNGGSTSTSDLSGGVAFDR